VPELALDDPKRMLHLGPHAGFELFGLFVQHAPGRVLLRLRFPGRMATCQATPVASGRLLAPW
jgi:hypothetical protein